MKRHTKRYMLIFTYWFYKYKYNDDFSGETKITKTFNDEYDTIDEVNEAIAMYREMYADTPKPIFVEKYYKHKLKEMILSEDEFERYNNWYIDSFKRKFGFAFDRGNWREIHKHYDCSNDAKFWNLYVLDFKNEKIMSQMGDEANKIPTNKDYRFLDETFRKDDEIPKDYKWDYGEYTGWLQFRWGNGLNAIDVEDARNERIKLAKETQKSKSIEDDDFADILDNDDFDLDEKFANERAKELKKQYIEKFGW